MPRVRILIILCRPALPWPGCPGRRHRGPARARLHAQGHQRQDREAVDFKGKHVVLEWTNPGCPFVLKHYNSGNMPATQKDATGKGVVWLAINSTEKSQPRLPGARQAGGLEAGAQVRPQRRPDGRRRHRGQGYGARTTPHMYIVNPQGQLIYAGGIDSIPRPAPTTLPRPPTM
jgi:hypothetical protein